MTAVNHEFHERWSQEEEDHDGLEMDGLADGPPAASQDGSLREESFPSRDHPRRKPPPRQNLTDFRAIHHTTKVDEDDVLAELDFMQEELEAKAAAESLELKTTIMDTHHHPHLLDKVGRQLFRVVDLDGDGDLDLHDLVLLPSKCYRCLRIVFGASRRALPLRLLATSATALVSVSVLVERLNVVMEVLEDAYDYQFRYLPVFLSVALPCVLGVDSLVLLHGVVLAAYRTESFLCGPRGQFCQSKGDRKKSPKHHHRTRHENGSSSSSSSSSHGRSWVPLCGLCLKRGAKLLLTAVAALGRGAFAVVGVVLLWASFLTLLSFIVVSSFFLVMVLAAKAVCGRLEMLTALSYDDAGGAFDDSGIVPMLAAGYKPFSKRVDKSFHDTLDSNEVRGGLIGWLRLSLPPPTASSTLGGLLFSFLFQMTNAVASVNPNPEQPPDPPYPNSPPIF
jgi:hypothetical protein